MIKRLARMLVVLAFTLMVLPQVVQGGAAVPLVGNVWQWQETLLSNGTVIAVNDPPRYTVEFMAAGRVSIKADCNTVQGTYQAMDGQMSITLGPATLVACPPDSQADIFLRQLGNVNAYVYTGNALFLNLKLDAGGMHFVPLVNADLIGTAWTALAFHFKSGFTTPLPGTQLTIQFGADGTASGSSGCNSFTGSYQVSGSTLTFGPFATTRMACAPEIMDQEQGFLTALAATTSYRIVGTTLTLSDATGVRMAEFVTT